MSTGLWQRTSAFVPGSVTILLDNLCAAVSCVCASLSPPEKLRKWCCNFCKVLWDLWKKCCVKAWNLLIMKSISFFHALSSFLFLMQWNKHQKKKKVSLKSIGVSHSILLVPEFLLTQWQKLCSFLDSASSKFLCILLLYLWNVCTFARKVEGKQAITLKGTR